MPKPTIILVPGAFFTPDHFEPLVHDLNNNGYKCVPISLPSNQTKELLPATLTDDTNAVRQATESEIDKGNNVMIVAHSYGAVPTNNALQGLDKRSRGHQPAVVALVFISAAFVAPGLSFLEEMGGESTPLCDVHFPFVDVNEPGPAHWFFHDLPADEAARWSSNIVTASWKAYEEPAEHFAMKFIPSWYLYTTQDVALPIPVQQFFVKRAMDYGAQLSDERTLEIWSGHSPFLSQVTQTSHFIRSAAKEASTGSGKDKDKLIRVASRELGVGEV